MNLPILTGCDNVLNAGIFNQQLASAVKAGNTQANKLLEQVIPKKTSTTPFVNNVLNQNTNFGAISITNVPVSGNVSLFGGGGGGAITTNINQTVQNTNNISNQVSNQVTTTNTTSNNYSSQSSNIVSSPFAGSTQTSTPSTTVTPTASTTQETQQTATPTNTTAQTGAPSGMAWWQWLLIGGVALAAIYMISNAFKGKKGSTAMKVAKYA
jgi:hypothetical protein